MKYLTLISAACAIFFLCSGYKVILAQDSALKLVILKNDEAPEEPLYMNMDDKITLKIINNSNREFQFSKVQVGLVFGIHQQISQRNENMSKADLPITKFAKEPEVNLVLTKIFNEENLIKRKPSQVIITVFEIMESSNGEINKAKCFTYGKEYIFWIMK